MHTALAVNWEMVINGHRLFIMRRGPENGPAVVLLHHGLGSTRAWRRQVLPLAEAGYHVLAYDRWGYGRSDPRHEICVPRFENDQRDLLALMDRLEVRQAALVGHSDGGTIALYFAAAHPERVACLVTIAAHIYVEPGMGEGLSAARQVFETDPEFRRRFWRAHGEKSQQVLDNWFNGWLKPGNLAWDMRPELAKIHCPTLVIQGLEDEYAAPQHAEDLRASIPGARSWLIAGAGHLLQRDRARELNLKLIEFLRQQTGDGKRPRTASPLAPSPEE